MKRFLCSPAGCQAIVCVLGACVSLTPTVIRTNTFWGELGSWVSGRPGVSLHTVQENSPAALAGLKVDDEILTVNEKAIFSGTQLESIWSTLTPGDEFKLRISRGGHELSLHALAVPAEIAVIGYWDWQLAAGFTFLALAALLIATQPLQSRSIVWRPALVAIVAFALAAAIPFVPWDWRLVWQQWSGWSLIGHFSILKAVAVATAISLAFLAAYEIQTVMRRNMDLSAS